MTKAVSLKKVKKKGKKDSPTGTKSGHVREETVDSTTTKDQSKDDKTEGNGTVDEAVIGSKKGEDGTVGKKEGKTGEKKGKKKKTPKEKKVNKKQLEKMLKEERERLHHEKVATRLRRHKEMELRKVDHTEEVKVRNDKLYEEMTLRDEQLPRSLEIFGEQDGLFHKWELEQKEADEWETYLRCDPLPLPYDVPALNAYLYQWHEEKNAFIPLEDKKFRIEEVLKLLNMVDDYLENPVGATERLISMLVEVRDKIREELQIHLDMSSYVVLRQLDQMEGEGYIMGEPEVRRYTMKPCPDISLFLWAAVIPSYTTAFEPAPPSAYACSFPDVGMHVQLPPHAVQPETPGVPRPDLAVRNLHLSYDHYSTRCRTNPDPKLPEEFSISLVEVACREKEAVESRREAERREEEAKKAPKTKMKEVGGGEGGGDTDGGGTPSLQEDTAASSAAVSPILPVKKCTTIKDPRIKNFVGGLGEEEEEYICTENGRKLLDVLFLSERELVGRACDENFVKMVFSVMPPWIHVDKEDKYEAKLKKYGTTIPKDSIAFGHYLDTEEKESIRMNQLKAGAFDSDVLEFKEKAEDDEEEKKEDEEGKGGTAGDGDDLVAKLGTVLIEESDVEYSDSSEESLPVITKLRKQKGEKTSEPAEETQTGSEDQRRLTQENERTDSSASITSLERTMSSYGSDSSLTDSMILEEVEPLDLGDQSTETEGDEPDSSDNDNSSSSDDEDWSPTGEFDTSGTDEGLREGAWRKDWKKRKAKGGKVGKKRKEKAKGKKEKKKGDASPKKGAKKGGKKGGKTKKGSPKKKKGSPKKKKGSPKKKKGSPKKKKGSPKKKKEETPLSSPLTPSTPEDPWLIEERDALERDKEREKEYGKELRARMAVTVERGELNLRRYAILGGVTHLDLLMHPPQPYQLYNSSMTLTQRTLHPISKTLKVLDISDSTLNDDFLLISLLSSLGGNDSCLQELGLSCMGFNRMPTGALGLVKHSLMHLSLYGNYFHYISKKMFPKMDKLEELDLRSCDIKSIEEAAFSSLPKLKTLLLSNNRISSFDRIFMGLNFLLNLDLSNNLVFQVSGRGMYKLKQQKRELNTMRMGSQTSIFPPSLKSLDLSFTEIKKIESYTFKGLHNLKHLSICYSKIGTIVNNSKPFVDLKNLRILDMSGNQWLATNLSSWIFSGLNSLQELYLDSIRSGYKNNYNSGGFPESSKESPFQSLGNLTILSMRLNNIPMLNQSMFQPLVNLEEIYLSNNHIIPWDEPLFSGNRNLKKLQLHQNQINYISEIMLVEFHRKTLSLYDNPILCNCKVSEFTKLANNGTIDVEEWNDVNSYRCIDKSRNIYINFKGNWSARCEPEDTQLSTDHDGNTPITEPQVKENPTKKPETDSQWSNSTVYISSVLVLTAIILSVFVFRKWKNIRYFGQLVKNVAVIGLMSEEKEPPQQTYSYDVFVSYSDPDRSWVLDKLLPSLELTNCKREDLKQLGPPFKVCLHERDFIVGSSILENIVSCMDNSQTILLVVSDTFLRSQWCQFEMHLAQHRLLETRRDDLLLVLLEEIPKNKRPKTLHYLMMTKTYLIWNEETQDLFWKRLRRAIKSNPVHVDESTSSFP